MHYIQAQEYQIEMQTKTNMPAIFLPSFLQNPGHCLRPKIKLRENSFTL